MTFEEYENEAAKTSIYPNRGSNLTYATLGLVGEAGEVANQVKKIERDDNGKISFNRHRMLVEEVGDVLWYCSAMAHELGMSLEAIAQLNVTKLRERHLSAKA
jgi:NTP pyrophosphatase (non-canonical NTP hydrolase)